MTQTPNSRPSSALTEALVPDPGWCAMSAGTADFRFLSDRYDVIVVGARCAGAATAMLLARAGLSVLAVDRARPGSDTLSTHALTRPGVLQLSRWGVLDVIRAAGTPRVEHVTYHYGDEVVDLHVRPHGDVDGLYAPRRPVLDQALAGAAVAAGAHLGYRCRLDDLLIDADGRVSGVLVTGGGIRRPIGAGMVIGADGARSTVARITGAPVLQRAAATSTCIYGYLPGLPSDRYRIYHRPGLVAGVIPTNGGEANVWVSVTPERFEREARADVGRFFADRLAEVDGDLAALVPPGGVPLRRFTGLRGFLRQPWGLGWALVGDAVYFKDPVSAHGMTDALIGAELLARAVIERFDRVDEATALAGYATTRAALAEPMLAPVAHLAGFGWRPEEAKQSHLAQDQAMRAEWDHLSALGPMPVLRSVR